MAEAQGKAWPLADAELTNSVNSCDCFVFLIRLNTGFFVCLEQILDLVQQAGQYKQLKKGANEGTLVVHSL